MADELDAALREIRTRGGSPIEAIKLIQTVKGIPLAEAKEHFAQHPAWADIHEEARPLQDELERASERFVNPS